MESSSVFKLSSKFCSACNALFDSDELRRAHSKSQWHVENLRRRVAGLGPLDSSALPANPPSSAQTKGRNADTENLEDAPSSGSDNESYTGKIQEDFVAEQCIFCNQISAFFDDSVLHMQRAHGLYVAEVDHLAVDVETLVRYLHLVIFGYRECLYCHTQRRTIQAAQQHMIEKGHCKFSIEEPDSEYRDFFDFTSNDDGEEASKFGSTALLSRHDNEPARLPSGRVIAHRTAGQLSQGRQQRISPNSLGSSTTPSATEGLDRMSQPATSNTLASQALTRKEKRGGSLENQLANLSATDRASLAHLHSSQQHAVLAAQKKQVDKARRAEQRYRSRVEMLGNKTLMKTFVNDVPGPKNG